MRWPPVLFGFLLMLSSSYLDNSRGPLLPSLTRELGLGYTQVSWMLVSGFITAIACTFGMLRFGGKVSDRTLTGTMVAFGMAAALSSLAVKGLGTLLIMGALLGVAVSGLGAASNILVIQHTPAAHKARLMCLLHSMYGIGSFVAPGVVGWTVGRGASWPTPLVLLLPLLGLMAIGSRWVQAEVHAEARVRKSKLTAVEWWAVVVMSSYAAGEVLVSTWMVTYLVEAKGFTLAAAAPYGTGFFLAMGLTRLLCVVSLKPHFETFVVVGSLIVGILAFFGGRLISPAFLPCVGLVGPFFPLFLARVGKAFPSEARKMTLLILCCMQVTLCGFHLLVGRLTDVVGISLAFWLPAVLLTLGLASLLIYIPREPKVIS